MPPAEYVLPRARQCRKLVLLRRAPFHRGKGAKTRRGLRAPDPWGCAAVILRRTPNGKPEARSARYYV